MASSGSLVTKAQNNSGFVLLLVLVVLALSGTVLVAAARHYGQRALEARQMQQRLQMRWGAISSQAAVLPLADDLLAEAQPAKGDPLVQAEFPITLGDVPMTLLVGDEQAKANVNLLAWQGMGADTSATRRGQEALSQAVRRMESDGLEVLPVVVKPTLQPYAEDPFLPLRYLSFDQVFTLQGPQDLVGTAGPKVDQPGQPMPPPSTRIPVGRYLSCWGPGPINLRRAPMPVMREVFRGILTEGQVQALDRYRRSEKEWNLYDAISSLQLTKEQIDKLMPLATDSSTCFSLWVIAQGQARRQYQLYVQRPDEPDFQGRAWVFKF